MRPQPLTLLALLCCSGASFCASAAREPAAGNAKSEEGEDRSNRCKWLEKEDKGIVRFSVLPGGGWDNLRNREMGLVADLSFSDCSLSDDGSYVTPSHVILYPKRESQVSLISSVVEHYDNYSSTTSVSINLGGNGILHGVGIDGKMSWEFQEVKKTALASKTQIGRSQQRYNMYTAQLQPDFKLSESFGNRLTDIGNALINNQTKMARYMSDLLVRDFGTHVVTSVDAGAILEKIDYFNRNSLTSSDFTSNKLSQCMSASFANVFGIKYDSSLSVTEEQVKQYVTSVQKTSVNTHGGPPVGAKINLDDWEARLKENLVAIDKIGDPLFSVISERSVPWLPLPHLKGVIDSVKDAVLRYYQANEVKGCMDPNSGNFEPLANVAATCKPALTNFSFAGVFQTCSETRPDLGLGICGRTDSPVQRNPITGDFSCPGGYEPVKMFSIAGGTARKCFERYTSCWVFFTCSDGYDCYDSSATVTAYWCAAVKGASLAPDSGMIYGGAYSPRFNNPATDAKTCGANYRPFLVARDISMCLSTDIAAAAATRTPLGGFFTCRSGNPLAEAGRTIVSKAKGAMRFWAASAAGDESSSPKRCPEGFSQSTVDIVDGCELMQCARLGGSDAKRVAAKRPPFEEADFQFTGPPVTTVEWDNRWWRQNGTRWVYQGYRPKLQASVQAAQSNGGSGGIRGAAPIGALVALLATIGLVILAAVGYALRARIKRRLRRRRGNGAYRELDASATEALVAANSSIIGGGAGGGYGSVGQVDATTEQHGNQRLDDDAEVVMETPPRVN